MKILFMLVIMIIAYRVGAYIGKRQHDKIFKEYKIEERKAIKNGNQKA